MLSYDRRQRKPSLLALCGGLIAAAAVGLGAYAAHGVADAQAQSNLQSAAVFGFGHGVALAALSAGTSRSLGRAGLYLLLFGTLLFSGSLVLGVIAGMSTRFAPFGGLGLMLGWVLWALDAIRR
jgi:uncharacterized membrane protein YgdD (TMEM256/DUF423 family)